MAIELEINGYFDLTILNLYVETEVEKDIELGILDNLQQGEYVLSINKKEIFNINDMTTPIYKFLLEPTINLEYSFEEF